MKEILTDIDRWLAEDTAVALATVIHTWGSAPRRVGAKMAISADGRIAGSVSGGCVEGAVITAGQQTQATGQAQLLQFGVADETAWDVGLACGGSIEVFVQQLDTAVYHLHHALLTTDQTGASVTVIQGPDTVLGHTVTFAASGKQAGTLGDAALDAQARAAANAIQQPQRHQLTPEIELFIDPIRPSPKLVMVGGVHIAVALTSMAKTLGFTTTVIDPRRTFGSDERFPHVDRLIQAWPEKALADVVIDGETAVALLTHDPKIDDPALHILLDSPAYYVGALGSRKTHALRVQRLQATGFSDAQIGRIHAPIGLDIAAATPAEIALAVLAEIVKTRRTRQP